MNTRAIHNQLTVEEVLQKWPKAFSVFMQKKTKCPGCWMQHFCTLQDVAETYQIPSDILLSEIASVVDSNYTQRSTL